VDGTFTLHCLNVKEGKHKNKLSVEDSPVPVEMNRLDSKTSFFRFLVPAASKIFHSLYQTESRLNLVFSERSSNMICSVYTLPLTFMRSNSQFHLRLLTSSFPVLLNCFTAWRLPLLIYKITDSFKIPSLDFCVTMLRVEVRSTLLLTSQSRLHAFYHQLPVTPAIPFATGKKGHG